MRDAAGLTDGDRHASLAATLRAIAPAVALSLVLLALRVIYLRWFCPYTLIEDEAQYWVWSRMLDWSYYTKGPGVAWAIAAGTRLLGDAEWAVRLPAAVASAIGTIAVAGAAYDATRDRRAAWLGAVAFCVVPSYLSLGIMMTIDGPLIACWALAAWAAVRAFVLGKSGWIVALGVAIGVGTLFKYTMLLFVPGLLVWLVAWRREVRPPLPHAVAGVVAAVVCTLPIVIWNHQHGWPTIAHLLGHLGVAGGDMEVKQGAGRGYRYNPMWTLAYIGMLVGLLGPVMLLGLSAGVRALRTRGGAGRQVWMPKSLFIALSAPVLLFYLIVSFVAEPEGNWSVAAGVTLCPLAGWTIAESTEPFRRSPRRRLALFAWSSAKIIGVLVGVLMLRLDLLAQVPGVSVIPVGRVTDADVMGAHAARLMAEMREKSVLEPFMMSNHYGRAAQLWYYGDRSRPVYCAGNLTPGGRRTPWDFWPETNLRGMQDQLLGRPAVVVGLDDFHWKQVFERIERFGRLDGDHKRNRPAFLCDGFKGFPPGGLDDYPGGEGPPAAPLLPREVNAPAPQSSSGGAP
ncbi:MAG TPA: glycosyltransferase family 39 protein [Phycisphaerales bacterium]|nr:glycosyltransferase family 39 protein [Phycisphaerales bacterium]